MTEGEDDDILDLDESQIVADGGEGGDDTLDLEAGQEIANDDEKGEDEPEITVTIGDDEPEPDEEAKAPQWVRDLRKAKREADRRIKELEAQVGGGGQARELRAEPSMADHDYDEAAFKADHAKWVREASEHEAEAAKAEETRRTAEERWQAKLTGVEKAAAELGVKDYDDAEETARELLAVPIPGMPVEDLRLNIIKQGAKNPALVIYALGKNRKRAEELAKIDDPVEFAMAVGRMEAELKVNRKPAVAPEKTGVGSGGGTGGGAVDNQLDKLRAEAAKTGDYSKVLAYKRRKKAAA
jgi:hypothetical protein